MRGWYIVQTKNSEEFLADFNLRNQDFVTFLPKIIKKEARFNKVKKITKPLFPGYIFILVDNLTKHWLKVNYTRGVKKILTIGNSFVPIPKIIINEIKSKEVDGLIDLSKIRILKVGQTCKINNGIFSNKLLKIERIYKNKKIKVLLSLLNNKIKCLVPGSELEPAL